LKFIPTDTGINEPSYLSVSNQSLFNIDTKKITDSDFFNNSDITSPFRLDDLKPPYPKHQAWSYNEKYIRV
jgi:hypothetical protein